MFLRFIILISVVALPCFSQENDFPINFGLLGGLNCSYMTGSYIDELEEIYDNSSFEILAGNFGLRIAYQFNKWFEVESGAYFSGNGFKQMIGEKDLGIDWSNDFPQSVRAEFYVKRKIRFIEFPLTIRLQTKCFSRAKFRIYGFGGMRVGVVIKAMERLVCETITSNFPDPGESSDKDNLQKIDLLKDRVITDSLGNTVHYTFDDFYRRGNLSVLFGLGFEKRFEVVGLFVQGHFQYGLLNFNRLSEKAKSELANFGSNNFAVNGNVNELEAYFTSIQISTGINFYINR